ncbi:methylated-DNA--[protein]-cysteine S-methyltransferase [Brevibacillus dissolubilis]|uniref:methylated-DNA--[protein]-cysteine S-methyltransferase n=1 Tax=Brevibacillus dissolubilis TaxID=1844116 RepID=UPI0011160366|nr:methylated-DNA--[protein]-cysteine S-methyltransferase [Brevibacillus dissolubilis]
MKRVIGYTTMESPIGPLLLASTDQGLCAIEFGPEESSLMTLERLCRKWQLDANIEWNDELNQEVKQQLEEYFRGERKEFEIRYDLYGTPFQKAVWTELTRIPYGETRSYKDIALGIGAAKAVRAIGGANHNNPIPIIIPCHRVIGSNGALVGYGGGLSIKETLLQIEGILGKQNTRKASY